MGVRVEYEVRKLPDSYVTKEIHYAFEQDGDAKDKHGNPRKIRVEKEVEVRGGYLIVMRGKPGHTIRIMNAEQARVLGISLEPRLINTETGEECDKHGVPLTVRNAMGTDNDRVETDIDVTSNDSQLELDMSDPADSAIGEAVGRVG